jgi:hypothetical protein
MDAETYNVALRLFGYSLIAAAVVALALVAAVVLRGGRR